jgi:hypothetical protein
MVRRLVPELGFMRFPVKLIAMAAFALPVLAAFGIASCQSAADESRGSGLAVACVVMGLVILGIAWFAHARPLPYFASGVSIRSAVTRLGIVLLTLGGVAILLKTARPDLGLLLRGGVLALVWLDLTTQSPLIHPQADGELFVPNVMPSELKPHPGESRLMVSPNANYTLSYNMLSDPAADFALRRNALVACCNLLEDAPKLDGFFSLYPRDVREVLSPIYMPTNGYPERLADFLGVSRFNTATGNFKWEARTTYLPLITAGQRPIFADRDETLKAMLGPDFDPARVVYLPIRSVTGVQVYTNTQARVRSSRFGAHRVEFEIECASPSLAVIAQTYYHRWHAYIGGNEIPLLRANHGFQAIQAPTGKSNVELVYEDAPFGIGVVLSALTVLGLGAVWVKARRVDIGPSSS